MAFYTVDGLSVETNQYGANVCDGFARVYFCKRPDRPTTVRITGEIKAHHTTRHFLRMGRFARQFLNSSGA